MSKKNMKFWSSESPAAFQMSHLMKVFDYQEDTEITYTRNGDVRYVISGESFTKMMKQGEDKFNEFQRWKELRDKWQLAMDTPVYVYKPVKVNNDGTFEGGFCHRHHGGKTLRPMRRGRDFCQSQMDRLKKEMI